MKTILINQLEQINRNLYKFEGKYFRMFGKGITPNYCWIIAPEMRELIDIDVATGKDVYGENKLEFDSIIGNVQYGHEFIKY